MNWENARGRFVGVWVLITFISSQGFFSLTRFEQTAEAASALDNLGNASFTLNPSHQSFSMPNSTLSALVTVFSSCSQTQQSIQVIADAIKSPNSQNIYVGPDTPCPDVGVPDVSDLSCPLKEPDKIIEQIEKARMSLQCKNAKLTAIKQEFSCMSNQADQLTKQMQSLQQSYLTNIQKMQQDVKTIDVQIEDRVHQINEVTDRLGDDEYDNDGSSKDRRGRKSGQAGYTKGLLHLQEELRGAQQALPAAIEGAKTAKLANENARKNLTEQTTARTMQLTSECFTKKKSNYRCTKNDKTAPTVSDYILCRYEQNQFLGADNKTVETDAVTAAQAIANAASLRNVLGQIFSDMPTAVAKSDQERVANGNQSTNVTSVDDLKNKYLSQLQKFDGKGLDISGFIVSEFTGCFNNGAKTAKKELTQSSSTLGTLQQALTVAESKAKSGNAQLLDKFANTYQDAMHALTGNNYPLAGLTACKSGTPEYQVNCLNNQTALLEGMSRGTTTESVINMTVAGKNTKNTVNFQCSGVDGCVSKLQDLRKKFKADKDNVKTYKSNYVLAANQNIESYTTQVSAALSMQSQQLANKIKQLNASLAGAGVSDAADFEPGPTADFEKDENGLIKPPKDISAILNGKMKPPLPAVSGSSMSKSMGSIGAQMKKNSDDLGSVDDKIAKVKKKKDDCSKEKRKKDDDVILNFAAYLHSECTKLQHCVGSAALDGFQASLGLVDAVVMEIVSDRKYDNKSEDVDAASIIASGGSLTTGTGCGKASSTKAVEEFMTSKTFTAQSGKCTCTANSPDIASCSGSGTVEQSVPNGKIVEAPPCAPIDENTAKENALSQYKAEVENALNKRRDLETNCNGIALRLSARASDFHKKSSGKADAAIGK